MASTPIPASEVKLTNGHRNRSEAQSGPALTEPMKQHIRGLFAQYETKRAVLLPALHLVQETHGYISDQAAVEVAEILELSPTAVLDVVTFYTYFWRHKRGKFHLTICRSIACQATGFPALYRTLKETLGISDHETTKDGKFSIHLDECLALCGQAPCMLVNEVPVGPLTPEKLQAILKEPEAVRPE